MTGSEMKAIINEKRKDGQELLTIMLSTAGGRCVHFTGNDTFNINNIKSVGGVDCFIIDHMYFNSQVIGSPNIQTEIVHPVDTVDALVFVDKDRKVEVSPRDLWENYS